MSYYDQLDRALASRYAPSQVPYNDLVCAHADRAQGERICDVCRAEVVALLDNEQTDHSRQVIDAIYARAVNKAVEHFAPNLAVLEEADGRFYAVRDTRRVACVHDEPVESGKRCTQCDVMAYRLNQAGHR